MADSHNPQDVPPQRLHKEYEDPHYHDEDEVAPLPSDDTVPSERPHPKAPRSRKLLPRPRRFDSD